MNFREVDDPVCFLKKESDWLGCDATIDAVGCEARGSAYQRATGIRPFKLQGGAATAVNWAVDSVRKGGVLSFIGVYGPIPNLAKIGDAMKKGLTIRTSQAAVKRNLDRCFYHIEQGHIKPKDVNTHKIPLEEISKGYRIFSHKLDGCIKPMVIPPRATNSIH